MGYSWNTIISRQYKGELPPIKDVMLLQIPYALSPFFGFSLNPPVISVSLGNCGSQNWVCLSCVIASALDAELMKNLRGQKRVFSSSSPMDTLFCWGKQSSLSSIVPTLSSWDPNPSFFLRSVSSSIHPEVPKPLPHSTGNLMIIYHNHKCFSRSLSPE